MRIPRSTYRLQITPTRTLRSATPDLTYLRDLGADWIYLSPLLRSTTGSDHGYDVTDHATTDPARGGRAGLAEVADTAHGSGMGVLVDIVPNHVGVSIPVESLWWWDLLTHGRDSGHAEAFDVDWALGNGRVQVPVLGDGADQLDALRVAGGELRYYEQRFPIAPGTGSGSPQEVHDRQHYELVNWRRADANLNYRRFFAVSTLAAIRVEIPSVFDDSHTEIRHWIDSGWVDGLRVDHPDGLADPGGYLEALDELTGGRYTLVEKILEPGESLPAHWKTAGTTGYDALAVLDRLFVDPAGQAALDALDTRWRGSAVDWIEMTHGTKRAVADGILHSEVLRLARLTPEIEHADDAIAELLSCFDVYRSYLPLGAQYLDHALVRATALRPDLAGSLAMVGERLRDIGSEVSVRFQQTSGMVMAKGVEDTAFYRWTRLTSLTEVGADPSVFAVSPATFHAVQQERQVSYPASMTALSTHDTKRGEDVRARISVLSEQPEEWAAVLDRLTKSAPLADGPLANLLWQAVIGAWPIERHRLHGYAEKASREAGVSTNWIDPDPVFEAQLHALVDAVYDSPAVHTEVLAIVGRLSGPGWSNSLSAKLIQLTAPGVPDVYQGSELWETSLVDPDNRRPVDFDLRRDLLARIDDGWQPPVDESGAAKMLVTSRALRLRRDAPESFTGYAALAATGTGADHLVAFDRGGAVTVATRLPVGLAAAGGWRDTRLELPPGRWRDLLTGRPAVPGVAELLSVYPVALLVSAE